VKLETPAPVLPFRVLALVEFTGPCSSKSFIKAAASLFKDDWKNYTSSPK
jgi:hypothetical protein